MPRVIIENPDIELPPICPACLQPATNIYPYRKVLPAPGFTQRVQVPVGYCSQHWDQLIQADKVVNRLSTAVYMLMLIAALGAAYVTLLLFPDFKSVPGDSIFAWVASTVIMLLVGTIVVMLLGGFHIVPFAIELTPILIRWAVERDEAKTTRSAISIPSFSIGSKLLNRETTRLNQITFKVVEPSYAKRLHELNDGSKLES